MIEIANYLFLKCRTHKGGDAHQQDNPTKIDATWELLCHKCPLNDGLDVQLAEI